MKKVDYEKAWKELEYEIRSDIDFSITALPDEIPNITDRMFLNALRRMEAIMKTIKERYSEEEGSGL